VASYRERYSGSASTPDAVDAGLGLIDEIYAKAAAAASGVADTGTRQPVDVLLSVYHEWDSILADLLTGNPVFLQNSDTTMWETRGPILFINTKYELDLDQYLDERCLQRDEQCLQAFSIAGKAATASQPTRWILELSVEQDLEAVSRKVSEISEQWDEYLLDSRAIFPWEIWINQKAIPARKEGEPVTGFVASPAKQFLFLHHYAGICYGNESEEVRPALLLDLNGVHQCKPSGDNITDAWGVSVTMSWNEDATGAGVAVHTGKRFSLAATTDGDALFLSLSAELDNYISEKKDNVYRIRKEATKLFPH